MPVFSKISKQRLATCHPHLQDLMNACIKEYDFAVICGHRGQIEQDLACRSGASKLKFPNSKHNCKPSMAVDIAPVKYKDGRVLIDWQDLGAFRDLADIVLSQAEEMGIMVRWGGDWDGNPDTPNRFNDLPHFELKS